MSSKPAVTDKLAELVDFLALRFSQLRPEGDPSEVAEQLVKEYAFQRSSAFTELLALGTRYGEEHAVDVMDAAYMSSDGILDGKLEVQRATKELEDVVAKAKGGNRNSPRPDPSPIADHPVVVEVTQRLETVLASVELSKTHFLLMGWLRFHATDDDEPTTPSGSPGNRPKQGGLVGLRSKPWREIDLAPLHERLDACIDAMAALDASPDQRCLSRCEYLPLIRRDVAQVRIALPHVRALAMCGRDASLPPVSGLWKELLGLPDYEYEHQLIGAIREAATHKYCLCHVLHLLNRCPNVRSALGKLLAEEQAKQAEAKAAEAAAAAAAEKRRQEEERKAAAAAAPRGRGKARDL